VALSLDLACIDRGGFSGDYTKAHQSLKWIPQVSFSDGVDQTLDFTGGIRGTSD
jgi:nucleoside-diphosphate-sugar epimerase